MDPKHLTVAAAILLAAVGLYLASSDPLEGTVAEPSSCASIGAVGCSLLPLRYGVADGLGCKDFCLAQAEGTKGTDMARFPCELYDAEGPRRECACARAAARGEQAYLDGLSGAERNACLETFALVGMDLGPCGRIAHNDAETAASLRRGCEGGVLAKLVLRDRAYDCSALPNDRLGDWPGLADMCLSRKATYHKEPSACEGIRDERLRGECREGASTGSGA